MTLHDIGGHRDHSVAGATDGNGQSHSGPPDLEPFALVSARERDQLPEALVDAYPMAQAQVDMVRELERDARRRPYHHVYSLKIASVFDAALFTEAVTLAVRRHPVLRTSFDLSGFGEPLALVHAAAELPVTVADLRGLDAEARERAVEEYVAGERERLFDISQPPLIRFGVHVLSDGLFGWTVTGQHAILDGWGPHSVVPEIAADYQRLLAGQPAGHRPAAPSYRDFVVAERSCAASTDSEGFWLDKLSDRPDCRLPRWRAGRTEQPGRTVLADRTGLVASDPGADEWRQRGEESGYGSVETLLPSELCDRLTGLAGQCGAPVRSVVLAAHLRVMSLVTGSADLLVGLTVDGQSLPLRVRLREGSWADLIAAARDSERELLPHSRYPLGALQGQLGTDPLFEVNLAYSHFRVPHAAFGAGQMVRIAPTSLPLNVGFISGPDSARMLLAIDYHADVLAQEQVLLMRGYYLAVLEAMTSDPGAPHHLAPLLGEAERAAVASWNDNAAQVPPVMVHQLVRERAAQAPDAVAVVSGSGSLTYAQLNSRANQLAWRLRELGVGPDVAVGLCVERSPEMVVGLLAILKAGGIYVPLDAAFPADRLAYMLGQVAAPVVLAHDSTAARLPAGGWRVINLDTEGPGEGAPDGNLPELATLDNVCYIIFTSGSTGEPKGVLTRHRNVTELVHGGDCLALTPADTVLQLAPLPFDNSTFEVWAPAHGRRPPRPAPADPVHPGRHRRLGRRARHQHLARDGVVVRVAGRS